MALPSPSPYIAEASSHFLSSPETEDLAEKFDTLTTTEESRETIRKSSQNSPEAKDHFKELPRRKGAALSDASQAQMFAELEAIFQQAEDAEGGVGVSELRARPDFDEEIVAGSPRSFETLKEARQILDQMWWSDSVYMARAAEVMADASRDRELLTFAIFADWRLPFGKSGVLVFFCGIVASEHAIDPDLMVHSLRLIGNSCADMDPNRERVISNSFLPSIAKLISTPMSKVAVPVLFNICVDYEPAQKQAVEIKVPSSLVGVLGGPQELLNQNPTLFSYCCRLLELTTSIPEGVSTSPDEAVDVIFELASNHGLELEDYMALIGAAINHLRDERFQKQVLDHEALEIPLSTLVDSYSRDEQPDTPSRDMANLELNSPTEGTTPTTPIQDSALPMLRNNLVQVLSDISALPNFQDVYPLSSPLIGSLRLWLSLPHSTLQICACIMLGNLARSDEICQIMVHTHEIHKKIITLLSRTSNKSLLHAAVGFLKNLSLPSSNRPLLGKAGLIPTLSRLWALDTLPQIQLASLSLIRLLLTSCFENVNRLLEPLSLDPDSPAHLRTYLSLLLSMQERSDQPAMKTEAARVITAMLRVLHSSSLEDSDDEDIKDIRQRFYTLHPDIAHPLSNMVSQSQWPVVRSEGWFAFALMTRCPFGAISVDETFQNIDILKQLFGTVLPRSAESESPGSELSEQDLDMRRKDRENALVCLNELLRYRGQYMPPVRRRMFEELLGGRKPENVAEILEATSPPNR